MKSLLVASEAVPLIKTGGLADVAGSLPVALRALGDDARIALPAYPDARRKLEAETVASIPGGAILRGTLGNGVPVYLFDLPQWFDRPGDPYHDGHGEPYLDNPQRYAAFSEQVARAAMIGFGDGWRPDVVHANDWQTGLCAPWLNDLGGPPLVFGIHNLGYHGWFDRVVFDALGLPPQWWSLHRAEFHGGVGFLKAGLIEAAQLVTVSPTYAREIQSPGLGFGLDGVLRHRADVLHGVLNGIDTEAWNPATDPDIARHYDAAHLKTKDFNKRALQEQFGLTRDDKALLVGHVGRLSYQKGMDLALDALSRGHEAIQFALLGTGDAHLAAGWQALAGRNPGRIGVSIGYSETLAHQIIAGADAFLMPSRYEPCGLTQMYALRYGTVPVVHATGGLADTVIDATPQAQAAGAANGVRFEHADVGGVDYGLSRVLALYRARRSWRALQRNGMAADFSWDRSARQYRSIYKAAMAG